MEMSWLASGTRAMGKSSMIARYLSNIKKEQFFTTLDSFLMHRKVSL